MCLVPIVAANMRLGNVDIAQALNPPIAVTNRDQRIVRGPHVTCLDLDLTFDRFSSGKVHEMY